MAGEKRLIDANALQFKPEPVDNIMNGVLFIRGRCTGKTVAMVSQALKCMINNAPTVDAVEVVRCKDCKHRYTLSSGMGFCKKIFQMASKDEDFCSYGERREGE